MSENPPLEEPLNLVSDQTFTVDSVPYSLGLKAARAAVLYRLFPRFNYSRGDSRIHMAINRLIKLWRVFLDDLEEGDPSNRTFSSPRSMAWKRNCRPSMAIVSPKTRFCNHCWFCPWCWSRDILKKVTFVWKVFRNRPDCQLLAA